MIFGFKLSLLYKKKNTKWFDAQDHQNTPQAIILHNGQTTLHQRQATIHPYQLRKPVKKIQLGRESIYF